MATAVAASGAVLLLAGCGRAADGGGGAASTRDLNAAAAHATAVPTAAAPFYANTFETIPSAAALTAIGRSLFFDPSLSSSGRTACATCHVPQHAFGPATNEPVQRAGADGQRFGVRAVPSLTYTQNIPPFTEHFFDSEGDDSVDQGPAGGRTWDGRSQSAHDQARVPLLSAFEMANAAPEAVVSRVEHATYADRFRETFGAHVFEDRALALKGVLLALETFQQAPAEFYPYDSKYDAYLRNQATLTPAEARGLAAFTDAARGNCARCHPSAVREGAFPQFTDFGYAAIGAPRNAAIPANADPHYFDLGLCGPIRTDLADRKEYCGLFRTPSLRNVGLRKVFFHNGVLHRLEDVVRFYVERDTSPEKWYPRGADGRVAQFNDLPSEYWSNLDRETPFDRKAGQRPALSKQDIQDIVAFLNTLTDGYRAPARTVRGL